jgi:YidC/Oxa1 family membrane protein insertase
LDKKTIIAVVICVLMLLFWGKIMEFFGYVQPAPKQEAQVQEQVADTALTQQPTSDPWTPPDATDTVGQTQAIMGPVDSLIAEKTIEVTTPLYKLNLTNYGGGINYIELLNYQYQGNGNVILAQSSDNVVPNFETAGGAYKTNRLPFQCDQSGFELGAGDSPRKLTFTYDNGQGGSIIKTYIINPDRYDIQFDITVNGIEAFGFERDYQLVWGITPPPTEKDLGDDYGYFKVVAMMDDDIELDDFENGRMAEDIPGGATWVGLRTKYFAAIMIPRNRDGDGVQARGLKREENINDESIDTRLLEAGITMQIPAQGMISDSYTLYAGPIDYNLLKKYNLGLEELTSLGWVIIRPFSIAIIWLLPKIYSVIPNYGMVVLIFSLLIKIITFPLSRKQTLAMTKMKDLQPKMKKLQEKFKNDPGRLNKEMMKLYKEAGANPLSGCLPLLPQMPLFFALFTVFKTTIEFRGASFLGWITDLSVPDPYYILPIIMVVTMFVQQKMTMTDPKQKMLMYMMPLFFGWLFMNFPAGLVLYWTGFNILSLAETVFVRKGLQQQEAVTVVEDGK